MPIEILNQALPAVADSLKQQPAVNEITPLWEMLKRLLAAHAPSSGANLLGGIGDDIAVLADGLGLRDRFISHLGSTGNAAIWLGSDKAAADLVVVAHMDRPSFRVKDVAQGELYPICANRFPAGEYRIAAKAVRFERGRLVVRAEGMLISRKKDDAETLHFEAKRGQLAWQDTVLMDVHPMLDGEQVIGSGLDNSAGVLVLLLTAAVLRSIETVMRERERRCLFVFTDQEEGLPTGVFGHGAARLTHALPPPTYGCVIMDVHDTGPGLVPQMGGGAAHSAVSKWGYGSIVPPNYFALAVDLADAINKTRPGTVQLNTGYHSRSDDMILGQWTRILGLAGPPISQPHTGQETIRLGDVQDAVWWLAYLLPTVLNLVPDLTPRYALAR
jgi:putative aminopeptidase FrvX